MKARHYKDIPELVHKGHGVMAPKGSDVADVARAIAKVVDILFGKRPFRALSTQRMLARRSST